MHRALVGVSAIALLPIALTLSPEIAHADTLFVADFGGRVGEYTTSGATVNPVLIGPPSSPIGIAASGANLFVTGWKGTIGEYTRSGATVNASLITGLSVEPWGIVVSGSNLFVTNSSTGTIGEYTTSGVTVNASLITGFPTFLGGSGATAIAVSGSNLFVGGGYRDAPLIDQPDGQIGEYTTSGATVNASLLPGGLGAGRGFFPVGIVVVPVPEPGTSLLVMGGALGLAGVRGRRRF